MTSGIFFVLAVGSSLVNGLAFDAPEPTPLAQDWGHGWSPAPTSATNSPAELVKRGLLEGRQLDSTILVGQDQTCGYLSGSAGAAYTCAGATATCNLLPPAGTQSLGAIACCANSLCYGRLYCINSADYQAGLCNDDCAFNTFTLKCTQATAPYCNTAVWAGVSVRDVYCAGRSVSTTQTISTTYSGQVIGGRFTQQVLDDLLSTTSSSSTRTTASFKSATASATTRRPQTTSSSESFEPLPTELPSRRRSKPIGAIVGGAVGGVAVLALIAFGIWFARRRNRKDKTSGTAVAPAVDNHGSQPPPVYIPSQSEMDGAGVVGKPAMTQTQQQTGYYTPGAGSKPAVNYEQQQQYNQQYAQPYNQQGSTSPGSTNVGTYDQRRESALSPISPQSGSVGGSPQMTNRESYVSTGYPPPPPPPASAGGYQVHEMATPSAYEMPGSPARRA